jgi:hypothetical protein
MCIFREDTDLELAFYYTLQNILVLKLVISFKNYQNTWILQTWGTYSQILRVIKFVIDTKACYSKVQPKLDYNIGWNLKRFCDRNWAGDLETRVSVTGFIIYLLNVPICWRFKSQKGVTPLSTETEYISMSKAVKEVNFVYYLPCNIHIKVNLLIVVRTGNIGAKSICRKML